MQFLETISLVPRGEDFLLHSLSGGLWSVVRGPSPGFVGALLAHEGRMRDA